MAFGRRDPCPVARKSCAEHTLGGYASDVKPATPAAVLVTGVYGTGKTAVVQEMAALLERADAPFAAIDLDWLAWANMDDHGRESERILLANLAAVVATFREAGMTRYLLAGSVESTAAADRLAVAIGMPMAIVRLTAPIEVIEQRLSTDPTTGRRDDLEHARFATAVGAGSDLGDLVVANDGPIGRVADEILAWLGWTASG
jgi:hypothetical protein